MFSLDKKNITIVLNPLSPELFFDFYVYYNGFNLLLYGSMCESYTFYLEYIYIGDIFLKERFNYKMSINT